MLAEGEEDLIAEEGLEEEEEAEDLVLALEQGNGRRAEENEPIVSEDTIKRSGGARLSMDSPELKVTRGRGSSPAAALPESLFDQEELSYGATEVELLGRLGAEQATLLQSLLQQHTTTEEDTQLKDGGESSSSSSSSSSSANERLLAVEVPSFWICNRVLVIVSVLGTIGFVVAIGLVSAPQIRASPDLLLLGVFPVVLVVLFLNFKLFQQRRFFALTDQRVLIYQKGGGNPCSLQPYTLVQIPYEDVVEVISRFNWLFFMQELEIRRKSDRWFSPTSISRQSGVKQEFIDGMPALRIHILQHIIQDHAARAAAVAQQQQQEKEQENGGSSSSSGGNKPRRGGKGGRGRRGGRKGNRSSKQSTNRSG
ncbi:Aly/REF export factor 2 [Balamuthia mandrillaris]